MEPDTISPATEWTCIPSPPRRSSCCATRTRTLMLWRAQFGSGTRAHNARSRWSSFRCQAESPSVKGRASLLPRPQLEADATDELAA
jgi:hypothetical protein